MLHEFNARQGNSFAGQTYIYRRSPIYARHFMILKRNADDGFVPVGDYTVLDVHEPPALTEKKLVNLVNLLNGSDQLIDLGAETKSRMLYHVVSHDGPPTRKRVMFYTLGDQGVSMENALFSMQEETAHAH